MNIKQVKQGLVHFKHLRNAIDWTSTPGIVLAISGNSIEKKFLMSTLYTLFIFK